MFLLQLTCSMRIKIDSCIFLDDGTSNISENAHENKPSAAHNHTVVACNGKVAHEIMLEFVKKHGLIQTMEFETPRRTALCKEGLKQLIETASLCDRKMDS